MASILLINCLCIISTSTISFFLVGFHIWHPYSTFVLIIKVNKIFISIASLVSNVLRIQLHSFLDFKTTFLMWNQKVQSFFIWIHRTFTCSLFSIGSPRSFNCLTPGNFSSPYWIHSNFFQLNSILLFDAQL